MIAIDDDEKCPQSYFLCGKNKCMLEIFRCDNYANCEYDESVVACAQGFYSITVKPLYLEHVDNWFLKLVLYYFNKYIFKNHLSTCSR